MNTIGVLIKKILDALVVLATKQDEVISRLRSIQDEQSAARDRAEMTRMDTDSRLSGIDGKLDRVLSAVQIPEESPVALKITLVPGDTNPGGS